jgi:CHAD domain-containing protein
MASTADVGALIALEQCLDRNVDDNAECKCGVLLDRSLRAKGNRVVQLPLICVACAAIEEKQRLADTDEITDLMDKLYHAIAAPGSGQQRVDVHTENDSRNPLMRDGPIRHLGRTRLQPRDDRRLPSRLRSSLRPFQSSCPRRLRKINADVPEAGDSVSMMLEETAVVAETQGWEPGAQSPSARPANDALTREFCTILRLCRNDLLAYRDIVLNGREPVGIHQTRVALRRMRAAMGLFSDVMGEWFPRELGLLARGLASSCGPARDWDVFIGETLPAGLAALRAGLGSDRWSDLDRRAVAMMRTARRLRRACHRDAREALQSMDYASFEQRLRAVIERLESLTLDRGDGEAALAAFASDVLEQRDRKVRKLGRHVDELSPEETHELRIRLKKLRYFATFMRHLFDAHDSAAYVEATAGLQDALGAMNDRAVGFKLLEASMAATRGGANDWLAGALTAWLMHETEQSALRADKAWQRFGDARRFWRDTTGND